jgi:hypothetical protein
MARGVIPGDRTNRKSAQFAGIGVGPGGEFSPYRR